MKRNTPASMILSVYHVLIFLFILSGCGNTHENITKTSDDLSLKSIGYDLNFPDDSFVLPAVLHEISGITVFDSSSIACVQDENGIIFIYDLARKAVTRHITFYGNGDYEGIARARNAIYVLKSNGTIYEIADLDRPVPPREFRLRDIPHKDIEGLCYDKKNHRLLIAPKDRAEKDSKAEVKQGLYGFDLASDVLISDPIIEFNISELKDFAASNNVFETIEFNKKGEPRKPDINFSPSAIAVHPFSGHLYLLSSAGYMLFVFSLDGTIQYMTRLDPRIFNMAEGITFLDNGDMLISNEGQGGNATLLRFRYRKD